jgi:Protein of unknown function (DUF3800)
MRTDPSDSPSQLLEAFIRYLRAQPTEADGESAEFRRAYRFFDAVVKLLAEEQASIIGEIFVKGERPISRWVYPEAVASIADRFENQLCASNTQGVMIMDARTKVKNTPSVHRVTTARFKSGGGLVPHLIESPTFGHSDAHVVLQIADIVASALLFPIACAAYCSCLIHNVHLSNSAEAVRIEAEGAGVPPY